MLKKFYQHRLLKTKHITFTKLKNVAKEYDPQPASKCLPEWYKATANRVGEKAPDVNSTIKKCIPVFDAITSGYILVTPFDVFIKRINDEPVFYTASSAPDMIEFHPVAQASKHPKANGFQFPKWINPWAITTPKGYSVLFVPPMHNPNPWFEIMPGMVDTDKYNATVNFPFVLKDANFTGLIPAGTPMVQIIPFKRESWSMEFGNQKNIDKNNADVVYLNSKFFDRYKRMFWSRKEYK